MNLETISYSTDTGTEAIEKLDRNQHVIKTNVESQAQQINVLSEKTAFTVPPTSGYTIIAQNCYKQDGKTFISMTIKKTDETVFSTGALYVAASNTLPAGIYPCNVAGYTNVSGETTSGAISNHIQVTIKEKNIVLSNTLSNLKAVSLTCYCG